MKKLLLNISEIHEGVQPDLMTQNIINEDDLFRVATICKNADIEERYINRIAVYNNELYVVNIIVYLDTRTNVIYSYRLTDNKNGFDYYCQLFEEIPEDRIIPLQMLKPLNSKPLYYKEDYDKLIETL